MSKTDKQIVQVLNDLMDITQFLAQMAIETNPGLTNTLGHVDFLIKRANRTLDHIEMVD